MSDRLRRPAADLLDGWPTLGSIAEAVRKAGAEVTVVLSSHRDAVCEREGVTYRFVAERWSGGSAVTAYAIPRLAHLVRALRPDVVHMNGFGFPFHTRALCAQGAPVLVQHHADNPDGRMRALKRWGLAKISAAAFTSSEQAQAFFARAYFRQSLPVFEIPESSTLFHDGDIADARRATGVFGDPAVLWVGHLNANKDPLTVLDGFARALRHLPNAHLWCCYRDAQLLGPIEARLGRDPMLAGHVHLQGPVEHPKVEQFCRAADFFVLGSRQEGCAYVVLEAIACGATPIVTDIPAFRALTGRGKVGILCETGNAEAFSAALESLSNMPKKSLRARAIKHFQEELSFPVLGSKLVAAYEAIIARHTTVSIEPR
ncbi:MAG TPA: glycosyltransferase family 4 protein [Rhizomicrobium sp.]|nr:glycosyltransferase family 4 protein [Rhizomicrobium sp.]